MNVPNIGQGQGSTAVLTRPQAGGVVTLPLREGSGSVASGKETRSHVSDSNAGFNRIGWFDVNGDGHIDERSSLAGGDATILLPHAVKPTIYSRSVARSFSAAPKEEAPRPAAADTDGKVPVADAHASAPVPAPVTDAQTRQAIDAYQRYGQPSESAPTERAVA